MNDDLLEQRIRETLRRAAPRDVPLTLEVRAARIPETVPFAPRRAGMPWRFHWRLPAAVGVTVAAVAIVAFAGLGLPFRTTPNPTPAAASQSPGVSGVTDGSVLQVVSGPAGLLAVGVDDPTGQYPRIWTSSDGRSWQAMTEFDTLPTSRDSFAIAAAPWRSGWAVVAGRNALTSADGKSWTYADLGGGTAWGVVASAERIVAVGYRRLQGEDNWPTPAIWTSTDGVSWTLTGGFAVGTDFGNFWGVTAVEGGFLAYGFVHEDATLPTDGSADSRVATSVGVPWFSADGQSWSRVTDTSDTGPFVGRFITQVIAGGPGFIAVGRSTGRTAIPAIWTSVDGRSWQRQPGETPFASMTDTALGLGGDGHRVVAFVAPAGRRQSQLWNQAEMQPATAAWTSSDGVTWQDVPSLDGSAGGLVDVVAVGGKLYAVAHQAATSADCGSPTPTGPSTPRASAVESPPACSRISMWVLP